VSWRRGATAGCATRWTWWPPRSRSGSAMWTNRCEEAVPCAGPEWLLSRGRGHAVVHPYHEGHDGVDR
jgi:hypothetical protein